MSRKTINLRFKKSFLKSKKNGKTFFFRIRHPLIRISSRKNTNLNSSPLPIDVHGCARPVTSDGQMIDVGLEESVGSQNRVERGLPLPFCDRETPGRFRLNYRHTQVVFLKISYFFWRNRSFRTGTFVSFVSREAASRGISNSSRIRQILTAQRTMLVYRLKFSIDFKKFRETKLQSSFIIASRKFKNFNLAS